MIKEDLFDNCPCNQRQWGKYSWSILCMNFGLYLCSSDSLLHAKKTYHSCSLELQSAEQQVFFGLLFLNVLKPVL
jgi:hypothetical protein